LLAALPTSASEQLQTQLETVELDLAGYLQVPGETLHDVYFPTGAVIALVCQIDRHPPLAVGLVGPEGMVGLPVFLGADRARWGAQVYLAGTALRLPAEVLRSICQEEGPLSEQLRIYTDALLDQVIESAACGRFHQLSARLARWLLMTDDRSDEATFPLTHQVLAGLLGVRRESVSNAAGMLLEKRLIGYRRGLLQIVDRIGVEAIACACYQRPEGDASTKL
jgi:CRP-like cAMP-binding protein